MKNSKNITVSSLDSGGWPSRIPYSGEPPHHLVLHRHIHHHHTYNHSKLSAASIPPPRRFHSFDFKSLSGGFNSSNFDLACLKSSLKLDLWMSIRHIEKAVVGECHVSKDLVEKLPHNLVVIASHTTEMDKEKGMEIQPDRNNGESTSLITQEKPTRQPDHGSKIPSELMKQIISLFPQQVNHIAA